MYRTFVGRTNSSAETTAKGCTRYYAGFAKGQCSRWSGRSGGGGGGVGYSISRARVFRAQPARGLRTALGAGAPAVRVGEEAYCF